MLFRLALRNVGKTLPRRLAFGSFFAATMALLFLGNTLFETSDRGLSASYVESFTGQASISANSPEQFTLFGSDLPLIGEFLILPVLPNAADLTQKLAQIRPAAQSLLQVSAGAVLSVDSFRQNVPVFGVNLAEYFAFFPALKLVAGQVPQAGESLAFLTSWQAKEIGQSLGRPLVPGDSLSLSFVVGNSFVSRTVTLAGIYEHPVADTLTDRLVLTDPDTARALNGYLYGAAQPSQIDDATRKLLTGDLDSLFDDATPDPPNDPTPPPSPTPNSTTAAAPSAWNFLILREPGRSDSQLVSELKQAVSDKDVQVKDWRESAGGTAQIAWFLRILFNLGLLFIAAVSCLILINSLSLSILERTREIGTMRALGAERGFVGGLIAWETLILVVGTGLAGIAAGVLAALVLDRATLPLDNVYVSALFGGRQLHLQASWSGVVTHAALSIALGLAAVAFPVRKALAIQPVKAIARDQ